jgi:hypothetical protein
MGRRRHVDAEVLEELTAYPRLLKGVALRKAGGTKRANTFWVIVAFGDDV